jgi:hypothetical protein
MVSRGARIPETLDGIATDVFAITSDSTDSAIPSDVIPVGFGTPIISASGEPGAIACCASERNGTIAAATATHVVGGVGRSVYLDHPSRPLIGRCVAALGRVPGGELYPDTAIDADKMYLSDLALVRFEAWISPRRGLPAGRHFVMCGGGPREAARLLGKVVRGYGPATAAALPDSRGWRTGEVVGAFPHIRRVGADAYLVVRHQPLAHPGDSGSMWFSPHENTWIAVGLHWGLKRGDAARQVAVLTDIGASLRVLGATALGDGD